MIDDIISEVQKFPLQNLNWNITGPHPSIFQLLHSKCYAFKIKLWIPWFLKVESSLDVKWSSFKCHVNTEPSNHLKTKPMVGILMFNVFIGPFMFKLINMDPINIYTLKTIFV